MTTAHIRTTFDVVAYLRKYAMRFEGEQPMAIGVTPDAWTTIAKEVSGAKDDSELPMRLQIMGVLVVPA